MYNKKSQKDSMQRKFIEFLRRNNALVPFIVELSSWGNPPLSKYLDNMQPPSEYLLYGFTWADTLQGSMYWSNLNNKWGIICNFP